MLDLLTKGVIAHVLLEQEFELLQRHQDVVVVMGSERVSNDGSVVLRRRFTNLWRVEEGAWRVIVAFMRESSDPAYVGMLRLKRCLAVGLD
ncbi:hypothetical protein [Pedosphaera parvula]|uniref:DUF4440 domain-containing protein n=1 Tax=Pedosphaera parvula (strain Ellin514) TaxID=320771 RepID=B9XJC8_PEDPL|nr:hypothetical protein [Pedosphaera parvula]EEF59989.1 hypothetical protein Cflav_PD3048 [Pedosphaera parvula Ellin514]